MKILIAEDDSLLRSLLEEQLTAWGYDVVASRDGGEAWQILQSKDAPKLAILDWMMPEMDGVSICHKVRAELPEPYTYIILLTAQQRDEDLIAGMEAGADDYISKPFKHNELKVRLRAGRRIIELQNELLAAREILRQKASHDALTRAWNHEEILRILHQELARAEREGEYVGVIMADLDHFKQVNDTYGHMAGDAVLHAVAQRMQSLIRPYDYVGRYGGEEFMVVLPECCQECASAFAERIRQSVCGQCVDTSEGQIPITMSLGVAASDRVGGWNAQDLVKAADTSLYQAKKNGRNRVEVAVSTAVLAPND
ncbi:MAG: diguanylate cyclase [Desulfuromonadales bacterium]|nr:diguanylate cyclase [Desulfuromonadales bacterium]